MFLRHALKLWVVSKQFAGARLGSNTKNIARPLAKQQHTENPLMLGAGLDVESSVVF